MMIPLIKKFVSRETFSLKSEGDSMKPLFYSGDVIHYKKTTIEKLKVDDIVLVLKNKKYITHRVVHKSRNHIITKGDFNLQVDGKIFPHQIIAKVMKIKKQGRMLPIDEIYLIQSTFYFKEIVRLTKTLEKAQIDFVFLKGLPLHLFYERTHPRRIYADCDILINPNESNRIAPLLKKIGFHKMKFVDKSFRSFSKSPIIEEGYLKRTNNFPIYIDAHFDISMSTVNFPNLSRQLANLTLLMLKNKRWVEIMGESMPLLKEEDLLLYLCIHQVNHAWASISQLSVINSIIGKMGKKRAIDWGNILRTAKHYQILNFIVPSLYLLKKYYQSGKAYFICKKLYPNDLKYAQFIYKNIIDDNSSFFRLMKRLSFVSKRKLFIRFFLYDAPFMAKLRELLQVKMFFYLISRFIRPTHHSRGNSGIVLP